MTGASSDNGVESLLDYADSRGLFFVRVVDWKRWHRFDQRREIEEHETILRPILKCAVGCFAYGLKEGSEVFESISELARKDKGRHRIDISDDPISGHELFWNASGGKRGTVVVLLPRKNFPAEVFSHCKYVSVMTNPSAGHTPGAFRFAQNCANETDSVAVCFPRNNGFEWMDIFGGKGKTRELFEKALRTCTQGADA